MLSNIRYKRIFVYIFLLLLILLAFKSLTYKKPPKNLLLISIDTLRADHMGIYGYEKETTPNIDAWAKKGTVFTNATTVVPMTQPSFAALMTGKNPFKTRVISNAYIPVSDNNKTLASILSENGFTTGAFISRGYPLKQGFKEFNENGFNMFYYLDDKVEFGSERFKHKTERKEYEDFILESSDWLKENKDNKFFLWVHLVDPHAPYYPPDDLKCKFNENYCDQIKGKSLDELDALRDEFQSCQVRPAPEDRVEMMKTLYDGNIAAGDRLVGKILATVSNLGLDKDTLIVIYSDHGEGFENNYYFSHSRVLYDSSIKIPFIVIRPSGNHSISDIMIQNTDMLPTFLDLLGVERDKYRFDGKSFSSVFGNLGKVFSTKVRDYSISIDNRWEKFSITDGRYKYIYSLPGACINNGMIEEFYDLREDPEETNSLYSENNSTALGLKNALFDYLSDYNLPIDLKKEGSRDITERDLPDLNSLGY